MAIREVKLGKVATVKGGKRLPKGINLITKPNPHPYIRVRDLNGKKTLELDGSFEFVDDETQKAISRYIVTGGDIVLSIVGTIGLVSVVGDSLNEANLTENCVKLTSLSGIDRDYLYYYLKSSYGQQEIARGTVGAVQAKLPIKNIQDISIPLPDEVTQRKIADILSSLDAKIEVNQRINEMFLLRYWSCVCQNILPWNDLYNHNISKVDLRENYIVTQAVIIQVLGRLGYYFFANKNYSIESYLCNLQGINWKRDCDDWKLRTIRANGRMINNEEAITLTCNVLKGYLGLPLDEFEQSKESSFLDRK